MHRKVIIFEGIDHTGKTTAINDFIKYKDVSEVDTVHVEGKDPNTFEYYDVLLDDFVNDNIEYFVMDRAMIGELVYGPIYRNEKRISLKEIKELFEKYKCISFEINIKYVSLDNFEKYIGLLKKRDNIKSDSLVDCNLCKEKWVEQCMFKNIIESLKLLNIKNLKINESEFIPGGYNETV